MQNHMSRCDCRERSQVNCLPPTLVRLVLHAERLKVERQLVVRWVLSRPEVTFRTFSVFLLQMWVGAWGCFSR